MNQWDPKSSNLYLIERGIRGGWRAATVQEQEFSPDWSGLLFRLYLYGVHMCMDY